MKEKDKVLFAIDGERGKMHRVDEDIVLAAAGLWKDSEERGAVYGRRVRRGWANRIRRETR